ncbi:MAG: hypothetical protein KF899_00275 [Parvibaculum sp.]|nr:hypothetical protein [Parvibaculum sp.]
MSRFLAQLVAASLFWGCLSVSASADTIHGEAGEAVLQMAEMERGMDSASGDPVPGAICDICHVLQHVVLMSRGEVRAALAMIHVPVPGNERAASRLLSPEGPPPEIAIV